MPPPESGRALTSAQKQVLQQWISSGAEYQPHWAFVPVQRCASGGTALRTTGCVPAAASENGRPAARS